MLAFERLGAAAVARIATAPTRRIMLVIAQMIRHLGLEHSLHQGLHPGDPDVSPAVDHLPVGRDREQWTGDLSES